MPAGFSLGEWLAGVRLVVGWCLAVVSGDWAREPGLQAPRPQLHWLAGGTDTMAKGHNATRHRMWHFPVMLVTAMALTATVASAVGAIRLCTSRARGAGPGGSTPPGALALRYRPALHLARLANKQFELEVGEHKHRTRTRTPRRAGWGCTRTGLLGRARRLNPRLNLDLI